jgi:hypothetical protein
MNGNGNGSGDDTQLPLTLYDPKRAEVPVSDLVIPLVPSAFTVAGGALMTVTGKTFIVAGVSLFMAPFTLPLGIGLAFIGAIWTGWGLAENSGLRKTNAYLRATLNQIGEQLVQLQGDHNHMITKQLEHILEELKLGPDQSRVSLLKHEGLDASSFTLLGRASGNTHWMERSERSIYSDSEGLIGEAWKHGKCFRSAFPDRIADEPGYLEDQKKRGHLNKGVAKKLRMPSRSYAIFQLKNLTGQRIGVIVFESTLPDAFGTRLNELEQYIKNSGGAHLEAVLNTMKNWEPSRLVASEDGF